jgi:glycosyltransferase involved in cell wall biosynthesis
MTNTIDSRPHWVVAHCGARDQYQLPIALHESGQLHRFVTDWYSSMDNPTLCTLWEYIPQRVLSTISRRYHPDLPSRLVKDLKLKGALKSVFGTNALALDLNRLVGERAALVASSSGSHLLITSYYGWAAFPQLSRNVKRVLFQIHPHPRFLRDLYRKHERDDEVGDGFDNEIEMKVGDNFLRVWGQESLDADVVIAASSFTRKSLLYAGVRPERILVLPYGVDSRIFRNDADTPSGKPKVLFVGQNTSRKGFQDLLRTWKRISNHGAELHVVSGSTAQSQEVDSGRGTVVWHERLALTDLVTLMNRVDLLVLPSIAEGFGHVLLQALSCGTPILCSDATAGPDLLTGWEEGFVFSSEDWNEFASRLDFWLTNVDRLRRLRDAARTLAEGLPWERFREGVRNACSLALRSEQVAWT